MLHLIKLKLIKWNYILDNHKIIKLIYYFVLKLKCKINNKNNQIIIYFNLKFHYKKVQIQCK